MFAAIIGTGMLGCDLKRLLEPNAEYKTVALSHSEFDLTDATAMAARFDPAWDVVFNCAAYTAVDKAEEEPHAATAVNATGAASLAQLCKQHNTLLIHVSTDYVFNGQGTTPYLEDDATDAINVYGQSKLDGEIALRASGCDHVIARTQWLYGAAGPNFVKTMANLMASRETLAVVNDQQGSPTYTKDLAAALLALAKKALHDSQWRGTYHVANSGACTWYDFACAIRQSLETQGTSLTVREINPCSSDEYPRPAKRPAYSVLNTDKFTRATGSAMRPWQAGLQDYIANDWQN